MELAVVGRVTGAEAVVAGSSRMGGMSVKTEVFVGLEGSLVGLPFGLTGERLLGDFLGERGASGPPRMRSRSVS